jgi:hypothetical protein
MQKTEYDLMLPSDGFASGGLLTVYDDGKSTVRTVIERCKPGMNGSWHVVDDNPNFPKEMLPALLASLGHK